MDIQKQFKFNRVGQLLDKIKGLMSRPGTTYSEIMAELKNHETQIVRDGLTVSVLPLDKISLWFTLVDPDFCVMLIYKNDGTCISERTYVNVNEVSNKLQDEFKNPFNPN